MAKFKQNIPNILTGVRIILVPLIIWFFVKGELWESLALLALSAITDIADGKIARKYNYITDLGKILDPIADKLTIATVIILLWLKYGQKIPGLTVLFCILLGKDVLMLIGCSIFFNLIKKPVGSLWYGKLSTVVFYSTALAIILLDIFNVPADIKNPLIFVLVLISAAAAVTAFICYVVYACKTYKAIRSEEAEKSKLTV